MERWAMKKELYFYWLRLKRLENTLTSLTKKATYFAKQSDPQYFNDFRDLLTDSFWILPSSWNHTNPELVYLLLEDSQVFSEFFSDKCIILLLGTRNDQGESCVVSSPCRRKMTKSGYTDYLLSHQLLYFIVGKMKGCTRNLFTQDAPYYTNMFCANMMKKNVEIEYNGFPKLQQDLFMENIMLCGLSGFLDFYKLRWMNEIISWQDSTSGCFDIAENFTTSSVIEKEKQSPKRVKRREKKVSERCLCHKTSVAVGALGGFLYSFQLGISYINNHW
ncbi:hypothetical protein FKM82_003108 [Ascaphus truei]